MIQASRTPTRCVRFWTRFTTTNSPLFLTFRKHFPAGCVYHRRAGPRPPGGSLRTVESRDVETVGPHLVDRLRTMDAARVPQRSRRTRVHVVHGYAYHLDPTDRVEYDRRPGVVAAHADSLRTRAPIRPRSRQLEALPPHSYRRKRGTRFCRGRSHGCPQSSGDLDERAQRSLFRARALAHLHGHPALLVRASDHPGHRVLRQISRAPTPLLAA